MSGAGSKQASQPTSSKAAKLAEKAAAKAAKADRRAASKAAAGGSSASAPTGSSQAATASTAHGTGQGTSGASGFAPPQPGGTKGASQNAASAATAAGAGAGTKAAEQPTTKGKDAAATDPLHLFLHLNAPSTSSTLTHTSKSNLSAIHPSVIRLALQFAEFKVVGANARCIAMLQAFKDVIASYQPPPQTTLTRHLPTTHLNPQIAHLIRARPLSVSMGTAIRYLKYEISLIEIDTDVEDAKAMLLEKIDAFIRDRILLADKVIEEHALSKFKDGDVILTYARSSVVEGVLLEAKRRKRRFSVIVVDSGPLYEGKHLLKSLTSVGISTTYVLLSSLASVVSQVSLCLLGTHAMLSNGSMFSRAGTAMVAMILKEAGVPVICCCETYKFSERVMLDSIVGNERVTTGGLTEGMEPSPKLSPLSLLYDVSAPEDVLAVVTEAGLIPVQTVPALLRDYKPLAASS